MVMDELAAYISSLPSPSSSDCQSSMTEWYRRVTSSCVQFLFSDNFYLTITGNKRLDKAGLANKITARALIMLNPHCRSALRLHRRSLVSSVRGMMLPITENSRKFKVRTPLPMKSLDFVFKSYMLDAWIHAEGLNAYGKRRIPQHAFCYQISSDGRGWLLGLAFHMASTLGHLVSNAEIYKEGNDHMESSVASCESVLNKTKPTYEDDRVTAVEYEWNPLTLDFFREHCWSKVCDAVISFAKHTALSCTAHASFNERIYAVRGTVKTILLTVDNQLSRDKLVETFALLQSPGSMEIAKVFCSVTVDILEKYDIVSKDTFACEPLNSPVWTAMGAFLTTLRDIVRDGSISVSPEEFGFFSTRKAALVQSVLQQVKQGYSAILPPKSPAKDVTCTSCKVVVPCDEERALETSAIATATSAVPITSASVADIGGTWNAEPMQTEDFVQEQPPEGVDLPERIGCNEKEDEVSARAKRNAAGSTSDPASKRLKEDERQSQLRTIVTRQTAPSTPPFVSHRRTSNEVVLLSPPPAQQQPEVLDLPSSPSVISVVAIEQQVASVEQAVSITREVLFQPSSDRRVTTVGDAPLSMNTTVTMLFTQWFKDVIFCRRESMSPAKFFNDHVKYSVPDKSLADNDVPIFIYSSEEEYVMFWKTVLTMMVYTKLYDVIDRSLNWSGQNFRDPTYLGAFPVTGSCVEKECLVFKVSKEVYASDTFRFTEGGVVLMTLDGNAGLRQGNAPKNANCMCVILDEKRRKQSPTDPLKMRVSFSLYVMGVDGTYQDSIRIQDQLGRFRSCQLWLRESVRDEMEASVALSSFRLFRRYVKQMVIGDKADYGPMKQLQQFRNNLPSRADLQRYVAQATSDQSMAQYILWNTKLSRDESAPARCQHGPMNLSQCIAVTEATRCCESNGGSTRQPHHIEHDGRLGIIGPAGTGKTTTLINLLAVMLNSSATGRILLEWEELRKSWLDNNDMQVPQSFPAVTVKHLNVLILACTHSALDVIEAKILDGVSIVPRGEEDGVPTIKTLKPYYRRLAHARDRSKQKFESHGRRLRTTFPFWFRNNNKPSLTLCTFGSLWRAFNSNGNARGNLPDYDMILVDEASQAADHEFFKLFKSVCTGSEGAYQVPLFFFGDPMQQGPVIVGQGQGSLMEAPRVSLFERIVTDCDGRKERAPLCNSVLLDVQYRMHPTISALSNKIAKRSVSDCIARSMKDAPFYCKKNPGYVVEFPVSANFDKYRRPVAWIDPYNAKTSDELEQEMSNIRVVKYGSSREIVCIKKLIGLLLERKDAGVQDIVVITPYNEQRVLLQDNLVEVVANHAVESERSQTVAVSTVSAIQGDDRNCIIMSACKNRSQGGTSIGIVGDPKALYVSITGAKVALYIVGDADYLSAQSKHWNSVLQFCREQR